jgi:YVTN family beta-propeller protein
MLRTWVASLLVWVAYAQPPAAYQGRVVREGIAVDVTINPALREGQRVGVRVNISDTASGTGVSGLHPAAWMDLLPNEDKTTPEQCVGKVKQLLEGGLLSRAEVDLTTYYVLALNDDSTITVSDPRFGFGDSRLLALVQLPGSGYDWALTPAQDQLFVSIPSEGRVAAIETRNWNITGIPVAGRPERIAIQPDGAYAWVSYSTGVAALSTTTHKVVRTIETGAGPHDLAFDGDSRYVFVTNRDAGTVSMVDVASLTKTRDVPAGSRPVSIAWSPIAEAAGAVSEDGSITIIDGRTGNVRTRIHGEPGLSLIRFAPGGRVALILNRQTDSLHVLDAAAGKVVQSARVEKKPEHLAFTNKLAYVAHSQSETVLMFPLETLGREGERLSAADFPGGRMPLDRSGMPSPADALAQASGDNAILVANGPDKSIYFYEEGMAAPMGNLSNFGRSPRAVLVLERNLREGAPGSYSTDVQLGRPGHYNLAFALDTPRIVHCFDFSVAEDLDSPSHRGPLVTVESLAANVAAPVNQPLRLQFRLRGIRDGQPRTGVGDLWVLMIAPGIWQRRVLAHDAGQGVYTVEFTPPNAGVYFVYLSSFSQHLSHTAPQLNVIAGEPSGGH